MAGTIPAAVADCGLAARDFRRAFDLTGVQRHLKAAGIFARLKLRDGRDSHLPDIVPTLERVTDVAGGYPGTRGSEPMDRERRPACRTPHW